MTDTDDTEELSEQDIDALQRCMDVAMQDINDPGRAEQLTSFLQDRPWLEVAEFACFCVQRRALRLKPWECPPSSPYGDEAARRLLNKMLAAGVSQYDPDPLAALEAAALKRQKFGRKRRARKSRG